LPLRRFQPNDDGRRWGLNARGPRDVIFRRRWKRDMLTLAFAAIY